MLQMSEIYVDLGGTCSKIDIWQVCVVDYEEDGDNSNDNDDDVDKEDEDDDDDDDDDDGDGVHLQQLPLPVGNVVFQVDIFPKRFHIELKQNTASHPSQIKITLIFAS